MTDDDPDLRRLFGSVIHWDWHQTDRAVAVLGYARSMGRLPEALEWLRHHLPPGIREGGSGGALGVLKEFDRLFGPPSGGWLPRVEPQRPPREIHLPPRWMDKVLPRLLIGGERPQSLDDLRSKPDADWLWTGAKKSGSGQPLAPPLRGERRLPAARVLWAAFRTGLAVDLVVHVKCGVNGCVNPWHAELVRRGSWLRA